jgi:hypothetical protein
MFCFQSIVSLVLGLWIQYVSHSVGNNIIVINISLKVDDQDTFLWCPYIVHNKNWHWKQNTKGKQNRY